MAKVNESERFSTRLKRWRARADIRQPDAARLLGIGRTYYSELENDREPGPFLKSKFDILEPMSPREIAARLAAIVDGSESESTPALSRQSAPSLQEEGHTYGSDPRRLLVARMEERGETPETLAAKMPFKAVYIREVMDGVARGSNERFLRAAARVLDLDAEALMSGSDTPRIIDETGRRGTFGAVPNIDMPPGKRVMYVPLLSWAQAGALDAGHTDEAYDYSGTIAVDVKDRKAFGVTIRGDSMEPKIPEGADVIVCPSWQPRNGDTVIARTADGDVMCKLYQTKEGGTKIVLSSHNPAFPPIELNREEIAWIYPVGQVVQNLRRE